MKKFVHYATGCIVFFVAGLVWGSAADQSNVYVALSPYRSRYYRHWLTALERLVY